MNLREIADEAIAECEREIGDVCVLDKDILSMSLAEHDKRFHKGGYKEDSYCAYRKWLMEYEGVDKILVKGSLAEMKKKILAIDRESERMQENICQRISQLRVEQVRLRKAIANFEAGSYELMKANNEFSDRTKEISSLVDSYNHVLMMARAKVFGPSNGDNTIIFGVSRMNDRGLATAFEKSIGMAFSKALLPKQRVSLISCNIARATSNDENIYIGPQDNLHTLMHEFAHIIERSNPEVLKKTVAFLEYRCHGEKSKRISKLTGEKGYKDSETARPDKFFHPYCGKDYFDKDGKRIATEIFSMGVEHLIADPVGFMEKDPEYFKFTVNIMRGV